MQNCTKRVGEKLRQFEARRADARRMIRMCIELVRTSVCWNEGCLGAPFEGLILGPPRSSGALQALPDKVHTDGCAYGMKTYDTKELILKSWCIQTSTAEMASRLDMRCQKNHAHAVLEGSARVNATSYYPLRMVRRWV